MSEEAEGKELVPYKDSKSLTEFLDEPKSKIAEALVGFIAGALSMSKSDAILAAGRVAQAAIKGNAFKQVGIEIKELMEKGKIPEDFAEKKYGFQSLSELLNFIDSEAPDADRLQAVKAMFYALNSVKVNGEEILRYQLFRLSMKLTASELLTLKVAKSLIDKIPLDKNMGTTISKDIWLREVAKQMGHGVTTLVEQDESKLIEYGLITGRYYNDKSGVNVLNGRLTDLGLKFCEYLEEYSF